MRNNANYKSGGKNVRKTGIMKSTILSLLAGAVISMSVAGVSEAREMRFSSFEPAQAFLTKDLVQAWIDKVNPKLSKGNQFKLYPGGILGSPPAQQELVKSGVADAALVIPNYSPGVFPLTSVVQVPFLAKTSNQGTAILQGLLEQGILDEEYKDFKLIALSRPRTIMSICMTRKFAFQQISPACVYALHLLT
jgi:TRAP-type C4-dicarboxylate transport system substrate-binding protein